MFGRAVVKLGEKNCYSTHTARKKVSLLIIIIMSCGQLKHFYFKVSAIFFRRYTRETVRFWFYLLNEVMCT